MMYVNDLHELGGRRICVRCINEPYLARLAGVEGTVATCFYCEGSGPSFTIEEMADQIEVAFETHYFRTPDQPTSWQYSMLSDNESEYDWERDGDPVVGSIMNAADIPHDAATDIQALLEDRNGVSGSDYIGEEAEFHSQSFYDERGANDDVWQEDWGAFERGLKAEARFFSPQAAEYLTSIFERLNELQTTDGRPLIVEAGPGTAMERLHRARAFQADDRLVEALGRPDLHLGPPPSALATAGRMNALGISAFYGTNEPEVAIAEVQPPVGSQVLVGQFEIIRVLRLLDLTALGKIASGGSIFDPETARRMGRAMFLRSLSERIARPVMPDDEPFEYLATQAVADFLATEATLSLDGIIFPSVQVAGAVQNVVLFHKAARLEAPDLPTGSRVEARTGRMVEEGFEIDYEVIERIPPPLVQNPNNPFAGPLGPSPWDYSADAGDDRPPTLRVIMDSLKVHIVQKVEYTTVGHAVRRYRWVDDSTRHVF